MKTYAIDGVAGFCRIDRLVFGLVALLMQLSALPLCADPVSGHFPSLKAAIDSLDAYIVKRDIYAARKSEAIGRVRKRLDGASATDSITTFIDLGDAYRRFNVDSSAFSYQHAAEIARRIGNKDLERVAVLGLCSVNPLRGIVRESLELFEGLDRDGLDSAALKRYYDTGFNLYLTSSLYYPNDRLASVYLDMARANGDSLIALYPSGHPHRLYHQGWNAMEAGAVSTALADMMESLEATEFGDELYARVTATVADCYDKYVGDDEAAAEYLALSAMSDVAAGTKETTSLQTLGLKLFERGDLGRAYSYLTLALENSIASGSKVRTLGEMNVLPVVVKAYTGRGDTLVKWLYVLVAVLAVGALCLMVLLVAYRRSHSRLDRYRGMLMANNVLKDEYIRQLLTQCSSYMERLEDLNKLIVRKTKAGQAADLCRLAESGDFIREQTERFLRSFDETFLEAYPDFINDLNRLLVPSERFEAPSGKRLTPELRIAALIRLGVDDGTRISRFLGLSLNTIYTYRNKLKNRAVDRDNFEEEVRKIGLIG